MPSAGHILLRWEGERLPLPSAARPADEVGTAAADATTIAEDGGTPHAGDAIYHYAVVAETAGGKRAAIDPLEIVTRVYAGGALVGLMPATPSGLDAQLLSGNRPMLTWAYSAAGEQARPAAFRIYAAAGDDEISFASAVAEAPYYEGQRVFRWVGAALSADEVRHYSVRAVTAGGVLSLIPRIGLCPSGSYSVVEKSHCPFVHAPGGAPPAIVGLIAEGA
ncbi:hypothetical protein RAS1_09280 [Phycisphaerae bacterium RAS1]|nr:hypothetical protein RAS1_09280 [Phycisphaerae bacterium RAS1]